MIDFDIFRMMIPVGSLAVLAIICSRSNSGFSRNVFLSSMAIGIAVLVWVPVLPTYMIVVSVLLMSGLLYSGGSFEGGDLDE